MRWIEQAEARQAIVMANFDRTPKVPWSSTAIEAAARLIPRLGAWITARHPMGWAVPQTQPTLVRQPARQTRSPSCDDEGYSCDR
jgi:hypothetical protein